MGTARLSPSLETKVSVAGLLNSLFPFPICLAFPKFNTANFGTSAVTLAHEILSLGKPVVLTLEGGRPFAIPEIYAKSAAILSTVS